MLPLFAFAAFGVLTGAVLGFVWGRRRAGHHAGTLVRMAAQADATGYLRDAEAYRRKRITEVELAVRENTLRAHQREETSRHQDVARVETIHLGLVEREAAVEVLAEDHWRAAGQIQRREIKVREREQEVASSRDDLTAVSERVRQALAAVCGQSAAMVRTRLADESVAEARAWAAQHLRRAAESGGVPVAHQIRQAKRVMGIAVGRYYGHYLIERHLSVVPLATPRGGRVEVADDILEAITEATGIRLSLMASGDSVRLEGLDGVAREVARRCINRIVKRPIAGPDEMARIAENQKQQLARELMDLGKRAFSVLQVPRAHPEIVDLVGRLNYRTSFTQNQWKHAVEAAFLCGMMAEELGLDVKVARRAALMHDIGKALTHEIQGSHAVIGADYARRLGESEVVANAIGAHHTEEPFSSAYAYLVAAADAMSGARPGARRQTEENFVAKVADLERICRSYPDVEEAFAVQGGREVRIYVKEQKVDDLGAINLSRDLAGRIADEMTFPGQIRITVIREFRAEENAG